MRNVLMMGLTTVLSVGILWSSRAADQTERTHGYGLGQPATDQDIQHWNIDVAPTGEGLPPGRGTAKQGGAIFAAQCASCHGPTGQEGPMDRLVGGVGTLAVRSPSKQSAVTGPMPRRSMIMCIAPCPFPLPKASRRTRCTRWWPGCSTRTALLQRTPSSTPIHCPASPCRTARVSSRILGRTYPNPKHDRPLLLDLKKYYRAIFRKRSAFAMTETELKVMAAPRSWG